VRKNLIILFLAIYSAGATVGNERLCGELPGCPTVQALLNSYSAYMESKRQGFANFARTAQFSNAD
jgi:hypothetical protein